MIDVSETCRIPILMVDIRLFAFTRIKLKARGKLSGSRHMTLQEFVALNYLYALLNRFL